MTTAAYRVHKLIQDLMRDPAAAARFADNPECAFTEYALTEGERAQLRDGSPPALHELGVHPNLQMKYARLRGPAKSSSAGPLSAYLERLTRS